MSSARGIVDEVIAVLIDGEAHALSECFQHIACTIDVALAVRHFELHKIPKSVKDAGAARRVIEDNPDRAVSEGRKIILLRSLRYMVSVGDIEAVGLDDGISTGILSDDNLGNIILRATPKLLTEVFNPPEDNRALKGRGTRVFDAIRRHMKNFATRGGKVSFAPPETFSFSEPMDVPESDPSEESPQGAA